MISQCSSIISISSRICALRFFSFLSIILQDMTDDLNHYTNTKSISTTQRIVRSALEHQASSTGSNTSKFKTLKELVPSLLDSKNLPPRTSKLKDFNQEMFKLSSLDGTLAALVNEFWCFGGNESSLRFIAFYIRTFPSFCPLGPDANPVT
ncbi:hypothetical protein HPG69_019006 [Diceros bicornis minor]|uniref:Glycine N-acyltransferase-like protein n=1 Tax=Diceros bicornis minor TaxID=77932 RepID=A0A7J7FIC8_DICBM|nr:hypothetical protein HPG69_019006 [Diceros bicornis minor]